MQATVPDRPILTGGSIGSENMGAALAAVPGVIVSGALVRGSAEEDDLVQWNADLCCRFMDAARAS